MQGKSVNGFTSQDVDAVLTGQYGPVEYRQRFELLDSENLKLRDLTSVIGGNVAQDVSQAVVGTGRAVIEERKLAFDTYKNLILAGQPLFYLRLGEPSGSAVDSTGNGYTGTLSGGFTRNTPSLLASDASDGSLTLNGSSGYVYNAANANFNAGSLAIELWVKTTASAGVLADRDDGGSNRYARLELVNGKPQLTLRFTTPATGTYTSNAPVNDGRPHHIVAVYDGAHVRIFVDSFRVYRAAETRTLASPTLGWNFGRNNAGTGFLNGTIDEAAVYPRALTSAEVRQHWQAGAAAYDEIDYQRDRLKVYGAVRMPWPGTDGSRWAEWSCGVWLFTKQVRNVKETHTENDCQLQDQLSVLASQRVSDRYTVPVLTKYTDAVLSVLGLANFDTSAFSTVNSPLFLVTDRSWTAGTALLDIVNDLLAAVNYRPLRFDNRGIGLIEPNVLPEEEGILETWVSGESGNFEAEYSTDSNIFEVPNVLTYARSNSKSQTISATVKNYNFSSPTSIPRRENREICEYDGNVDAADQATLTALVTQALSNRSQVKQLKVKTWLRPFQDVRDKITFQDLTGKNPGGENADYVLRQYSMPFQETGSTDYTFTQVISVS